MALSIQPAENQIPDEAYREYRPEIARCNLSTLTQISFIGMIGGFLLVIASLPPIRLLELFRGYFAIAVLFSLIFVLCSTVLKKNDRAVLPVYYAFIVLVLLIAILMGTTWGVTTNATTFLMLMTVLPLFIIDKPLRLNLLMGVFCMAFCVVDLHFKHGKLLQLDIANAIVFYLLSTIISRQLIRAKMSDIIIKHELKRQRDMDMLTKLSNRGMFERAVAQYIHESNKNAVLLIMDIDNFKSVNDTMGHAYGDMVLQTVGEYLRSTFRSSDTVSRLGGDEFVAFLPAADDIQIITVKAQELTRRVANIQIGSEGMVKIGASIGLARYPDHGCSFEELYKRADEALYRAKQLGKARCIVYDDVCETQAGGGSENEKQQQ